MEEPISTPTPDADGTITVGQARRLNIADPRKVPETLNRVARWMLTGAIRPDLARTFAYLAQVAVRASDVADLAERLDALEAAIESKDGPTTRRKHETR